MIFPSLSFLRDRYEKVKRVNGCFPLCLLGEREKERERDEGQAHPI